MGNKTPMGIIFGVIAAIVIIYLIVSSINSEIAFWNLWNKIY